MFGSEKIDNLTQELICLRQDFIELQRQFLNFMTAAKRLERKRKHQRWKFYHK
jgi:hypothetical protein